MGDTPARMDPDAIEARLAAVEEHVAQCRAAVASARDGDVTALEALGEEVDALAQTVAELRGLSTSAPL